jgi:hypothetical protein
MLARGSYLDDWGVGRMDRRVARTLEIMRHDYHRDFPLEELAAAVDLSPSRLALLFRREVGLPPKRYLARMRLQDAWAFLDELLHRPGPRLPQPPRARPGPLRKLVREHAIRFTGPNQVAYKVRTYGEERQDGTWIAWIEFRPFRGSRILRTGRETTQPSWQALQYWVAGLEPVYFDGAFDRAR